MIRRTIFVLFSLVLMFAASPVRADNNDHAVVQDQRGDPVYNTTGNCVRTRWMDQGDPCAPEAPPPPPKPVAVIPPPPPPPPPVAHTVISEAARTVYFPFNKADLTKEAKAQLDTLAQTLKAAKDIQEARVVGAADRIGSVGYNDKLSEKRAEAVRDYLIARGYANASVTHTKWVGKSEPITKCSDKLKGKKLIACLQNDRRVQIDIVYKSEVMTPAGAPAPAGSVPPAAATVTPPATTPMPMMPVR
jgi:outer membrane protein OmpA-like peptidoglycan-associated protein